MPTAKLTSKGQITIPIEVRQKLRLKAGDKIDFYETEDGQFSVIPKTSSIMDMKGILQKTGNVALGYTPTMEQMDQDILDAASEDYLRSIGGSSTVLSEKAS